MVGHTSSKRRAPRWGVTAFALIWLLLAGWFSFSLIREWQESRIGPEWKRTIGTVLSTEVAGVAPSAGGQRLYRPEISFSYAVAGQRYRSTSFVLPRAGEATDVHAARRLSEAVRPGQRKPVWYDPVRPDNAMLDLWPNRNLALSFGAAFWLGGLSLLAFGLYGRQNSAGALAIA
jgi:hypothetical protein